VRQFKVDEVVRKVLVEEVQEEIKEEDVVKEEEEKKEENIVDIVKEITLDDNDVFRIYELWREEKLGEKIESIIKVDLPINEELALDYLENGVKYKDKEYVSLITSVGMMKKEDIEVEYSCEYFFIDKDERDFKEALEDVASLGKLETKKGETMCINKDIVARLTLLLSSGNRVKLPKIKIAVLPEAFYKYSNNYLEFAEIEENKIDLNNLRLVKKQNLELEHTAMDGCGFGMPSVFDEIQKQLGKKYKIDFAVIRTLGTAGKGLIVRFDHKKYIKEELKLDKLIVKDMWNNDIDLMQVDVVLNESMVKWGKWFSSQQEIADLMNSPKYAKYKDLFFGFNITKVNKEAVKEYTEANYQVLSNIIITLKKLMELQKADEETYKKAIDLDTDTVRIMLGDVKREDMEALSPSTKMHGILQLDEGIKKCQSFYKVVGNLVNKKINELAGGGIKLKGNYKTQVHDIISYINSLVDPQYIYKDGKLKGIEVSMDKENGLNAYNHYVPKNLGKRVLARCPLNSATEIIKTELKPNKLYDKYFGDLTEELIFYPFDDTLMLQSGADTDGDISFVIEEETIYNGVIDDVDENGRTWFFHNQFDGKALKETYNRENMYKRILAGRGNSIGALSNKGAIISNRIQALPHYDVDWDCYFSIDDDIKTIKEETLSKRNIDNREKWTIIRNRINNRKENLKKDIEDGKIKDYTQLEEKEIEDFMYNRFQMFKVYSYYLTLLQMMAIDSPKTGINVDSTMLRPLNSAIKCIKKPRYIYYAKYKKENKTVKYYDTESSNSLLNVYANYIIKNYGANARDIKDRKYNNNYFHNLLVKGMDKNEAYNLQLVDSLKQIADRWQKHKNELEVNAKIKELREEQKKYKYPTEKYMEIQDKLFPLYQERKEEYMKINIETHNAYDSIASCYNYEEILRALHKVRTGYETEYGNARINSHFIIEFAYEELWKHLLKLNNGVGTAYKKDNEGDVICFKERYRKVLNPIDPNVNITHKEVIACKKKLGKLTEDKRIGVKLFREDIEDILQVKVEESGKWTNYNLYGVTTGEKYGYIYPKYQDKVEDEMKLKVVDRDGSNIWFD